jgi:hypothetical protein
MKLEKLNKNILKDYEELNSNYSKLKTQKEKFQSLSEEQKVKINELNKEIKNLNNLLEKSKNRNKQKKHVRFEENDDEEDDYENEYNNKNNRKSKKSLNRYDKYYKNYDDSDNDNDNGNYDDDIDDNGYDYYDKQYNNNNFYNTSTQFYTRNKREFDLDDEYEKNNNYNKYINKIKNKNFNTISMQEDRDLYTENFPSRKSKMKQRKKSKIYYRNDYQDDSYRRSLENDEYLTYNNSTRNIFSGNKNIKIKLGEYTKENSSRKKINGKLIKSKGAREYYDGYEGFNCFPCEKKEKMNKLKLDELNNDLNGLIKDKNIMENKLINLPGQSKTMSNIRQKKELNYILQQTENKINEVRMKLRKLKGL